MRDRPTGAMAAGEVGFCDDNELGYRASLTPFKSDTPLILDEGYRLAQLPLVAPTHPRVIPHLPERFYEMGRHPAVFSVALPIDDTLLRASPAFCAFESELRATRFAAKIAWDMLARRGEKLHATICGSLSTEVAPTIDPAARAALAALGSITVELRSLFSGNFNHGRLYLCVHPEKRDGRNVLHAIQAALGRPLSNIYLVGLYNLTDDLDLAETQALSALIARWWDRPLLRMTASHLWLLAARDDLLLDSTVVEELPLVGGRP